MNIPNPLAFLLAASHPGETAMLRDRLPSSLLGSDLPADHLLALHGQLDRSLVTVFLEAAGRRMAASSDGSLFVNVSGHGFFTGDTLETALPGLLFAESDDYDDDGHLFWDDFFATLALPAGVGLNLLPDL